MNARLLSAASKQRGTERDILNAWRRAYRSKGWDAYARFEGGKAIGFNRPYILFKAKNVTDPIVRKEKWRKVRPIAPGTRHPMRRLLGLVGRAWSFVTKRENLVGDDEAWPIDACHHVPAFLEQAASLKELGELGVRVFDVEGAYPNAPKEQIKHALRKIVRDLKVPRPPRPWRLITVARSDAEGGGGGARGRRRAWTAKEVCKS